MPTLEMLIHTGREKKKLSPGDTLKVSELLADRWIKAGYAKLVIQPRKTTIKRVDEKKKTNSKASTKEGD